MAASKSLGRLCGHDFLTTFKEIRTMTYITRWEPFREINSLQNQMNRLFQDFGRGSQDELMTTGFIPAVDVYEDEQNLTLSLEVPGWMRMTSTSVWRTTSSRSAASVVSRRSRRKRISTASSAATAASVVPSLC